MPEREEILFAIKNLVREEIPDAKVHLFGSRVTGKADEESDWVILILTKQKYSKPTKWSIYDKLFPLSLSIGSVFHLILATIDEWEKDPAFYSLQKGIGKDYLVL